MNDQWGSDTSARGSPSKRPSSMLVWHTTITNSSDRQAAPDSMFRRRVFHQFSVQPTDTCSIRGKRSWSDVEDPEAERQVSKRGKLGERYVWSQEISLEPQNQSTTLRQSEVDSFNERWPCPMAGCHSVYSKKGDLKFHFKQKHSASMEVLYEAYPILNNARSSKTNKQWKCPISSCPCGYGRLSDLKSHFITCHPDQIDEHPSLTPARIMACEFCPMKFAREQVRRRHMAQAHGAEPASSQNSDDSSEAEAALLLENVGNPASFKSDTHEPAHHNTFEHKDPKDRLQHQPMTTRQTRRPESARTGYTTSRFGRSTTETNTTSPTRTSPSEKVQVVRDPKSPSTNRLSVTFLINEENDYPRAPEHKTINF